MYANLAMLIGVFKSEKRLCNIKFNIVLNVFAEALKDYLKIKIRLG